MIYGVSALLILAVAWLIAAPLVSLESTSAGPRIDARRERFEREKAAALLAIREAQLDQAMGKLSDDDYLSLRDFYERRAIAAMTGLDEASAADASAAGARLECSKCGTALRDDSLACTTCGEARATESH